MPEIRRPQTIAAAHGVARDATFGAVAPPLHLSSSYAFEGFELPRVHEYSRTSNPTRDQLAEALTLLEGGAGAIVTASGMAAIDLVLSRLRAGETVVAPHDCYSGTRRLLELRAAKGQFNVSFVDQGDAEALSAALRADPKLVLIETPSNPLLRVVDIATIAEQAKGIGAAIAVDNTFLSPALQNPIAFGADFVIHSTTKYLNGHSDVVGGAVIAATKEDAADLAAWANATGVTGAPFDAYQTLRGLRTLFPRIERQQQNARAIAKFLTDQSQIANVWYPGLASHPSHEIAARQQRGFGAMLSFELKGNVETVAGFLEALQVFTLAESLGGVESLAAHPATMTHSGMSAQARQEAGIKDTLVRLSIGLEAEADLIEDLAQALYHAET
jgi:cystathionine gamma-synthase